MKTFKQIRNVDPSGSTRPVGRIATAVPDARAGMGQQALLDSLPAAVWEIDAETLAVSYSNRRAAELFGVPALDRSAAGEDWLRRLFGEDGARLGAVLRQVRADGTPRRIEHGASALALAGTVAAGAGARRFESSVQVSRRTGDLPRTLSLMTVEAPAPRDQLGPILQAMSDGVLVRDAAARLVFANDAAAAMCGFATGQEMVRAAEAAGQVVSRFQVLDESGQAVPPELLPGCVALAGHVVERLLCFRGAGEQGAGEIERWTSVRSTPVFDTAGEVRYSTSVIRDVTSHRQAAEWQRFLGEAGAMLSSSLDLGGTLQRLAEVAASSLADWCTVDTCQPDGTLNRVATARALRDGGAPISVSAPAQDVNAAAAAADSSAAPRAVSLFPGGRPELYPDLADRDATSRASDPEQLASLRRMGLRSAILLPLTARGEMIGVVTLAAGPGRPRYSSADLAAAEELAGRASVGLDNARLYAEAQDAARAREDLLAIVSHDLRNPLGVVLTSSALLLKGPLPADKDGRARRQVEAIQRAGHRMNRLIRDLLDFASIKAGQLSISPRPHDAREVVREVLDAMEPLAAQKQQRLLSHLPDAPAMICGDRDRMAQVLTNLVGNAMKFTPEGGSISVSVAIGERAARLTVADTGPGMSTEELQHIFDRYWQAKRRDRDGIGLGLSIVKGIVDAHGGSVWAESEIGRGTTVHVAVPLALA